MDLDQCVASAGVVFLRAALTEKLKWSFGAPEGIADTSAVDLEDFEVGYLFSHSVEMDNEALIGNIKASFLVEVLKHSARIWGELKGALLPKDVVADDGKAFPYRPSLSAHRATSREKLFSFQLHGPPHSLCGEDG